MKIYGVNTSHDTALCVNDDGVIKDVFEEERSRREKYFTIGEKEWDTGLVLVEHKQLETPDEVVFASFDRRQLSIKFNEDLLRFKRKNQDELLEAFTESQLTSERIEEIREEHPQWFNVADNVCEDSDHGMSEPDFAICESVAEQLGVEEYFFEHEHHLYHAECGYILSPWKDTEDAIAITFDGGGAQLHYDTHPNYQEIEGIWKCSPNKSPVPQFQKFSNHRFCGELHNQSFTNYMDDCFACLTDLTETIDGVESVFTSMPSMGMNFSNMSYALGCDDEGRAAGKVMGMASYGSQGLSSNVFNKFTVAQELELQSFGHTCDLIQKAIDLNPEINNIVLSGGFALNCTNNYKYLKAFPDKQFFVDPIPHDGGTSVGASSILYRNIKEGETENVID